ncbi:alpha/beta hydrolase, partial [Amnibacterium sp.]|uniref:alpha/beta hydrolase n=1 Tax=Amnibacterium sp. TaxID=1872496 RepID=UPI0026280DCD
RSGTRAVPAPTRSTAAEQAERAWPAPAAIGWHACSDPALDRAQCATVAVPMDWSTPGDGKVVHLAISRVRHTVTPYDGVMLVNPGGPGVSGLALSTVGAQVPGRVGDRYDWIGFDPRGVGASTPRLSCIAHYAAGPRPLFAPPTATTITTWLRKSAAYATACGTAGGALLDHITTEDTAKDMEYLRLALAAPRISYYGYSYGTYLGQVYATLFPSKVDRMVLDSNVDPRRVWYASNLDQDVAFQTTVQRFFAWVAKADATYHLGATTAEVEQHYAQTAQALASSPAGGVLGADELADTVLEAGYVTAEYPAIAGAWAELVAGDPTRLIDEWRATDSPDDDNGYAVYLAVECTDTSWPSAFATWQRDADRIDDAASFETWPNTWFNMPCRTWPAKPHTPVRVNGAEAPPVLLVDETLDAATPYEGSLEVRSRFPRARLLAEPGGLSHADTLSGNSCVDGTIARYLDSGDLPARKAGRTADATCAPSPLPSPR